MGSLVFASLGPAAGTVVPQLHAEAGAPVLRSGPRGVRAEILRGRCRRSAHDDFVVTHDE